MRVVIEHGAVRDQSGGMHVIADMKLYPDRDEMGELVALAEMCRERPVYLRLFGDHGAIRFHVPSGTIQTRKEPT